MVTAAPEPPAPTVPLTADDYRILHSFRYVIRRFIRFSEEAAQSAGLDPRQHQLLLAVRAIEDHPGAGANVRLLAESLQIRHNTAVELVDRASRNGYVRRARCDEDRRLVRVSLTPEGDALLERLSHAHLQELRSHAQELVRVLTGLLPSDRRSEETPG